MADQYLLPGIVGIIVAIAVVGAILAFASHKEKTIRKTTKQQTPFLFLFSKKQCLINGSKWVLIIFSNSY